MIVLISIVLALIAIYLLQERLYAKKATAHLTYHTRLSSNEVFAGEDVHLYEEIENRKLLPLPYVKVNTDLCEGLTFHLIEKTGRGTFDRYETSIQSMFVLHSHERIRRRWRITCKRRGVYRMQNGTVQTNNLLGLSPHSVGAETLSDGAALPVLVVLPRAVSLAKGYVSSHFYSGDVIANHAILTDPLLRAGTREYNQNDPMNRINWISTAAHGQLMAHIEEYTRQFMFNIFLNMHSRDIEMRPEVPSAPQYIEQCITVAASLFDRVSHENVPVRLICNTPPETLAATEDIEMAGMDEKSRHITVSRAFRGKSDMINGLRLLASVQMKISCPLESVMEVMLRDPHAFASGGNLIFISSYFSERMILFHQAMAQCGVHIIYYITSTNQNALQIPGDIEVYFALGK